MTSKSAFGRPSLCEPVSCASPASALLRGLLRRTQPAPTKALPIGLMLGLSVLASSANAATLSCPVVGNVTNTGTTSNGADCKVLGVLNNDAGATLNNSGSLSNYGTVNNAGTINDTGLYGGLYNHHGAILNNSGTLTTTGGVNQSSLNNSGTLSLSQYGVLVNSIDATLNNSGTLNNNHALGEIWNNFGTLNNLASGTLNNAGMLRSSYGTINNFGTLNNTGDIKSEWASTLNNFGTLNNGSGTLSIFGTLNNSGVISALRGGTHSFAATINNSGFISIQAGGFQIEAAQAKLNNSGTLSISYGAQFSNGGLISNSGTLVNSGYLIGPGTFTQTAGSTTNNGNFSQGTLNIQGGTFTQTALGTTVISGATNNNASIVIQGNTFTSGTFTNSGYLEIDAGGKLTTGGFLQIGGTTVLNGGTIDPPLPLTVIGGSFGGTGTVIGDLAVSNATLVVGPGGLDIVGSLTETGGMLDFLISDGNTTDLSVSGGFSIEGSTILFSFAAGSALPPGWNIYDFIGGSFGTFVGDVFEYKIGNGPIYGLTFDATTGNLSIAAVPEPETYAMLLAGLGVLAAVARRRKKADRRI